MCVCLCSRVSCPGLRFYTCVSATVARESKFHDQESPTRVYLVARARARTRGTWSWTWRASIASKRKILLEDICSSNHMCDVAFSQLLVLDRKENEEAAQRLQRISGPNNRQTSDSLDLRHPISPERAPRNKQWVGQRGRMRQPPRLEDADARVTLALRSRQTSPNTIAPWEKHTKLWEYGIGSYDSLHDIYCKRFFGSKVPPPGLRRSSSSSRPRSPPCRDRTLLHSASESTMTRRPKRRDMSSFHAIKGGYGASPVLSAGTSGRIVFFAETITLNADAMTLTPPRQPKLGRSSSATSYEPTRSTMPTSPTVSAVSWRSAPSLDDTPSRISQMDLVDELTPSSLQPRVRSARVRPEAVRRLEM